MNAKDGFYWIHLGEITPRKVKFWRIYGNVMVNFNFTVIPKLSIWNTFNIHM
jgi:hypothetical protein